MILVSFAIIFDAIFIVFLYFLFSNSCLAIFANAVWAGEIGAVVAILGLFTFLISKLKSHRLLGNIDKENTRNDVFYY